MTLDETVADLAAQTLALAEICEQQQDMLNSLQASLATHTEAMQNLAEISAEQSQLIQRVAARLAAHDTIH